MWPRAMLVAVLPKRLQARIKDLLSVLDRLPKLLGRLFRRVSREEYIL